MSEQDVAFVRDLYEAFDRGDVPAILGALDDDVSWNSPTVLPHGGIAHGPEEVSGFFQRLSDRWDDFEVDARDYVGDGGRVCVIGRATGILGGVKTAYGFVHCLDVGDGAVKRFHEYVDPERAVYGG